ncbi:MAG TPA: nucleotidyltransferase domain-containing protein [Ktedonobacterales bacterium]|nr:nucleotidyltransferase domain-containing protein [Ktedonobacterales bacterium]
MRAREDIYPGTRAHRRLLDVTVRLFAGDARVLAVVLFGSLARGNWDAFSDLDLDIVVADDVTIEPMAELERLCAAFESLGERAAVIVPKRADEGDIVLESLRQLSVRFHPLATTSPNIVESMRVLWGRISHEEIAAAGDANRRPDGARLDEYLGYALRKTVEASVALARHRPWFAVTALDDARDALFTLFGSAREAPRPLHAFEGSALGVLRAHVASTLPAGDDEGSLARALAALLVLIEHDLGEIAAGRVVLSEPQRGLIAGVRARLALLDG